MGLIVKCCRLQPGSHVAQLNGKLIFMKIKIYKYENFYFSSCKFIFLINVTLYFFFNSDITMNNIQYLIELHKDDIWFHCVILFQKYADN